MIQNDYLNTVHEGLSFYSFDLLNFKTLNVSKRNLLSYEGSYFFTFELYYLWELLKFLLCRIVRLLYFLTPNTIL